MGGTSCWFVVYVATGVLVGAEDGESCCLSFVELECSWVDVVFVHLGEMVRLVPFAKW